MAGMGKLRESLSTITLSLWRRALGTGPRINASHPLEVITATRWVLEETHSEIVLGTAFGHGRQNPIQALQAANLTLWWCGLDNSV
jgi:hypothetical protein